jgi:hypothetical protein
MSRVRRVLEEIGKSAAAEALRGYVAKRVKAVSVDVIIDAIERGDVDIVGRLKGRDREIMDLIAEKFGRYVDLLTAENVFKWMVEDTPFHAGVIYGHPKGLEWLRKTVEKLRGEIVERYRANVELVPVGEKV